MARLIHFFSFIYKCLLSIFDAPGVVFPDGGPRRGLCLAGLMVLEVYHRQENKKASQRWKKRCVSS